MLVSVICPFEFVLSSNKIEGPSNSIFITKILKALCHMMEH